MALEIKNTDPKQAGFRRYAYVGAVVLFVLVHMLAAFYFAPPKQVFSQKPLAGLSYELQVGQTWTVTKALNRWGESWAYNPRLRAGSPSGIFVDTNSRGWQLWTLALSKLGLIKPVAFNLFVLLAHLLGPFIIFVSARLFGLNRWPSLAAAVLGGVLWYFDGFIHWCWWSGVTAFAMASYLALLCFAILFRYINDLKLWQVVLFAIVLTLTLLIHPYVALALIVPFAVLLAQSKKQLKLKHSLFLLVSVGIAVAINLPWIVLRFKFWSLDNGATSLGLGTLPNLLTDFLGLTRDTSVSGGIGLRSGFRFLALGAAVITLLEWRKRKDPRFLPIAAGLGAMLAVTYLGGYLFGLGGIQPYRFIAPVIFLSVIPAAQLIDEVRQQGALRKLEPFAYIVLAIIIIAAIPRLARDVVYFVPAFVPEPKNLPDETPHIADIIGFGSIGYPKHRDYRHMQTPQYFESVVNGINSDWTEEQGRILVEYEPLAEHLAWRTKAHIIGGSKLRDTAHGAADIFARHPNDDPNAKDLRHYLETYAVGWLIVIYNPGFGEADYHPRIRGAVNFLDQVNRTWPFQVYRSQLPISYFKEGSGKIKTSLNRIQVTGTSPYEDIVLKYHYLDTFVCKKGCKIKREPIDGDPIGFIRIPAPHPPNFVIQNKY